MRKEEDDVSLKIFEKAKETEIKPPEEVKMEIEKTSEKPTPAPVTSIKSKENSINDANNEKIKDNNDKNKENDDKIIEAIIEPPIINILDEDHQTVIYKLSD